MVTIIKRAKPNHPSTMAETPTPVDIDPLPKFPAIVDAATLAVCCHKTETSTNIDATNMMARHIWLMKVLGSLLRGGPSAASCSYTGKDARRTRTRAERMIDMILCIGMY